MTTGDVMRIKYECDVESPGLIMLTIDERYRITTTPRGIKQMLELLNQALREAHRLEWGRPT